VRAARASGRQRQAAIATMPFSNAAVPMTYCATAARLESGVDGVAILLDHLMQTHLTKRTLVASEFQRLTPALTPFVGIAAERLRQTKPHTNGGGTWRARLCPYAANCLRGSISGRLFALASSWSAAAAMCLAYCLMLWSASQSISQRKSPVRSPRQRSRLRQTPFRLRIWPKRSRYISWPQCR